MTYRQTFDRLGNPVARRVRFMWRRRITQSCDADGVFIIGGCAIALAIIGLWMSGFGK